MPASILPFLALTNLDVPPSDIVECFALYRPHEYTPALVERNLRSKLTDVNFRHDLDQIVSSWPGGYDINTAAELVIDQLLRRIT